MFPSNRSTTRHLLPSTGSGRLPFPGFLGTMRRSDARPPFPPRSVSFARRYHPVRLCSCLPPARRRLGAWGFRVWQPRANCCRDGDDRASQVPGEPSCPYALFLDPGRSARTRPFSAAARPPRCQPRRQPTTSTFRGSMARPRDSLSTLRSPRYRSTTPDSLPVAGQALPDGIGYPQGSAERFQK